ncbi:MAG TPA: hypothetical protein VGF84_02690 [Micromonosporaceae bacterium]
MLVNASATAGVIAGGIGLVALIASLFITPAGDAPTTVADGAAQPTLAGLGSRVEQILAQAERQAADNLATAQRQADRIIADAQRKASDLD